MDAVERIGLLCKDIENELIIYDDYPSSGLVNKVNELCRFISAAPVEFKVAVENSLRNIIKQSKKYSKAWLYSAVIALNYNPEIMKEFLEYVIAEPEFSANVKYFIYYQIKSTIFNHIHLENKDTKYLCWSLLSSITESFRKETADLLKPIPEEERNEELALVITEQILGELHGPTKISLDRCKILIEKMHKKVLLINTAEVLSQVGAIPYWNCVCGSYDEGKLGQEVVKWKGTAIPYVQCENCMPNIADLRTLLQTVQNLKPGLIVSVGGSGILINLLDAMIPVLTVGLSPSDLESTMTTCQTLSRRLNATDIELLKRMGKDEASVIESIFTSSLQTQAVHVTRSELGLPEDKFVIVIVGYRLDSDIDGRFMQMLRQALDEDMVVAVIGQFQAYDHYMSEIPELKGRVHCLGLTRDILAWIEVCDLYVNPHRKGGGTSGVEALFMGLPVVTDPYGDVAANVGETFWTESYQTMPELIQRYKNDTDFYKEMSEKAKERSDVLLDSAGEFTRIIEEFEKRTR